MDGWIRGRELRCIGARERQLLRLEAVHVQIRATEGKQVSPRLPLINNPATALRRLRGVTYFRAQHGDKPAKEGLGGKSAAIVSQAQGKCSPWELFKRIFSSPMQFPQKWVATGPVKHC